MSKAKLKTCVFEEWKRESKCMGFCGLPATKKVGAAYLCGDHALYCASLRERTSRTRFNVFDVEVEK